MTTAPPAADATPSRVLNAAELRQRAEDFVRDYVVENGKEPTGELVGDKFGMKDRWGRDRVAAARGSGNPARRSTPPAGGTTPSSTGRGSVADDAAARAGAGSGTTGVAAAVIGGAGAAQAPARRAVSPPSPPARAGAAPARTAAQLTGTTPAQPPPRRGDSGQLVAWLGFAFGAFVSIAANVMHALIPRPPDGLSEEAAKAWTAPEDWAPDMVAVYGAAVWPLMLLLAVEVMSRVRWAEGWGWSLARYGGVGTVGLGSAIISYGHIRDVLLAWHYGDLGAHIGPLVVDGLMVISGFALLSISRSAHLEGTS